MGLVTHMDEVACYVCCGTKSAACICLVATLWRPYGMENAVLLARYFVVVGTVLATLLFVANWIWPSAEPVEALASAQDSADAPIARIHSIKKWPDKIQFDTSMPTIVPPAAPSPQVAATVPPPAVATNTASASPLDARAEVKPNVQPAPPRKRLAKVHHRGPRQATSRWADANPMARPWSWSWNW